LLKRGRGRPRIVFASAGRFRTAFRGVGGSRIILRSYVSNGFPVYGWVLAAQVGQHRQHAAVVGLALA
jgi:hypothetical protein